MMILPEPCVVCSERTVEAMGGGAQPPYWCSHCGALYTRDGPVKRPKITEALSPLIEFVSDMLYSRARRDGDGPSG